MVIIIGGSFARIMTIIYGLAADEKIQQIRVYGYDYGYV